MKDFRQTTQLFLTPEDFEVLILAIEMQCKCRPLSKRKQGYTMVLEEKNHIMTNDERIKKKLEQFEYAISRCQI